jgi:AcrR family transcriptional regulator
MVPTTATRLTAEERRVSVLRAAMTEFAQGGYAGTSTEDVAKRAGVSQPYLFRLFGTKRDLFVATVGQMHARIEEAFRSAADGLSGADALMAMGDAYKELLEERDLLLVQMHAYAASSDPEIRVVAREGLRHLWSVVQALAGVDDEWVRVFFAQGMLMNVLAAVQAAELQESWAQACQPDPEHFFSMPPLPGA